MIYKPAKGSILSDEQAQRYGEQLQILIQRHGGAITREDVVNDAKTTGSPLHDFFEWDDKRAAEKWRNDQAGYMVRSVHVVTKQADGSEVETRMLHNVHATSADGEVRRVYVSIKRLEVEPVLHQQVIDAALKELEIWNTLYHRYSEFSSVVEAIAEVQRELKT